MLNRTNFFFFFFQFKHRISECNTIISFNFHVSNILLGVYVYHLHEACIHFSPERYENLNYLKVRHETSQCCNRENKKWWLTINFTFLQDYWNGLHHIYFGWEKIQAFWCFINLSGNLILRSMGFVKLIEYD